MHPELLARLSAITREEQAILDGRSSIDRELYMHGAESTVSSHKLLSAGRLITVRPHTRFLPFPAHRHDYVEAVYMCAGTGVHLVNGKEIRLQAGELLFLSPQAVHEVRKASAGDVAVNFIILPDFFSASLSALGPEDTPLRRFLTDCLCARESGAAYLHFRTAENLPVQNLIENLLWILLQETPNRRRMSQMTMALLMMQLLGHTEALVSEEQDEAVWQVLHYVESNYADGSLTELADGLHYDLSWLSREIKRKTGKTYTRIVQEKRLAQAAFLLKNTDRNVADIAAAVGYENFSYFHRIFHAAYGKSPKHYRDGR